MVMRESGVRFLVVTIRRCLARDALMADVQNACLGETERVDPKSQSDRRRNTSGAVHVSCSPGQFYAKPSMAWVAHPYQRKAALNAWRSGQHRIRGI